MTQSEFDTVARLVKRFKRASLADLAQSAGWYYGDGTPNKMKVYRILLRLKAGIPPGPMPRIRRSLTQRYGIAQLQKLH